MLGRQDYSSGALRVLQIALIIVILWVKSVTGGGKHDLEASARIPAQLGWLLELGAASTLSKLWAIHEMNILLVLVCVVMDPRGYGWLQDLQGLGH